VRRTFGRSMCGHAQSESVVPWRGYVLWVGGTLLMLFFAADALMPPPAASRYFSATLKMPTIRIHSELKGPEAVVIDTSGFVRPELRNEQVEASEQNALSSAAIELQATPPMLVQTEVSGSASAEAPVAAIRETLAQLAPHAEVAPGKQASRKHRSRSKRARVRKTQPHSAASPEPRF
jgi:hypothetical protein